MVTFSIGLRNRSDYGLERVRVILSDPSDAAIVATDPAGQHVGHETVWDLGMLDRGIGPSLTATFRASGPVATRTRVEFRHRRPRGCVGDECLTAFISETTSDSNSVAPLVTGFAWPP
jgi:hypothetical protein